MAIKQLNILHINKYHYHRDGASNVYLNTAKILEINGHSSIFFAMDNPDNLKHCETAKYFMPYLDLRSKDIGIVDKLKILGRFLYSFEARDRLSKLLDKYPVDIAHLHNIYHHISPSILHELKSRKIPVVVTLHDYKLVCGSYSMIVDGKPCDACRGEKYFMIIKKRCVKGSLIKSILTTIEMYFHHKILNIYDNVDIFIAPSLFLKSKLEEMGFKKEIIHLPNFVDFETLKVPEQAKDDSVVYFGRLSVEKGLKTLIGAAQLLLHRNNKINKIKIIGEGPAGVELEKTVKSEGIENVEFLGFKDGSDLFQEVMKSYAVVIPSEWYENNPLSVLESFALGMPVIGARIGGIPELIKDYETGLIFEPGNVDDLISKIEYLENNPVKAAEMGENARKYVEQELNDEKYYEKLMEIYKQAISKNPNCKKSIRPQFSW